MSYAVIVTYGNCVPNQQFASAIKSRGDADKLKALAISKGYRDAEVWDEEAFRARQAASWRGKANSGRSNRGAKEVHGVRA